MAVKKHELVKNTRNQLNLKALEQYIKLINDQPHYLPPPSELIKICQDIIKCLAHGRGEEDNMWELLHSVEEFLVRILNLADQDVRNEVVSAILDTFYSYISDPQFNPCPATSVVLIVLDTSDNEATLSAVRWLLQHGENGQDVAVRAALACLYNWLYEWHSTPCLGDWVMAFINVLEESEQFDILIEVSVDNVGLLISTMDDPVALRQSTADVVFHVLASLKESTEALDRISTHVGRVLTNLASDSGQFSRQLLQNVVDIVTPMVDYLLNSLKGEDQEIFKRKYSDVASILDNFENLNPDVIVGVRGTRLITCLAEHMPSQSFKFSRRTPWRWNRDGSSPSSRVTSRKVGLLNLGNTCYMNSVMQALLVTRQFSTHVMMKMTGVPYWSKMGILFAKMMHSFTNKMNPEGFFEFVKPPFFTSNNQHDSSEFLGYLFELLKSFEHCSEVNFDYKRPTQIYARKKFPLCSSTSEIDQAEVPNTRRSVSPRPGGSGGIKRPLEYDYESVPLKKRLRIAETAQSFLKRDSFIDVMFGGVLLTRVECTQCQSFSLSRDVFRDLQLAFPEKRDGWQYNVQSLLEFYCSKERLSGDNKYQCRGCGGLRDAERSVLIESAPKYLILVLKNFKFDPKLGVQTKLMHPMYYDYTVNLPTVRSQNSNATYSLYAAVIHNGNTLDSGHYYTVAKDGVQWHMYNDELVTVADEKHVNSLPRCHTPYILFYRRTDIEEEPVPALADLPPVLQESVAAHNKHYVDQPTQSR